MQKRLMMRWRRPVLAAAFAALTLPALAAGDDQDARVRKALVERTFTVCEAVLPAWFASEKGIRDPAVRRIVVDCYTGHARLAVLGVRTKFSVAGTALPEIPAALLRLETGMNLDIYRPLAGRTLRAKAKTKEK